MAVLPTAAFMSGRGAAPSTTADSPGRHHTRQRRRCNASLSAALLFAACFLVTSAYLMAGTPRLDAVNVGRYLTLSDGPLDMPPASSGSSRVHALKFEASDTRTRTEDDGTRTHGVRRNEGAVRSSLSVPGAIERLRIAPIWRSFHSLSPSFADTKPDLNRRPVVTDLPGPQTPNSWPSQFPSVSAGDIPYSRCAELRQGRVPLREANIYSYLRRLTRSLRAGVSSTVAYTEPDGDDLYLTHKVPGRLGNQMFSVASLLGMANLTDRVPVMPHERLYFLPKGVYLSQVFNIPQLPQLNRALAAEDLHFVSNATADQAFMMEEFLGRIRKSRSRLVRVSGYTQSYRYFVHLAAAVRCHLFVFHPPISAKIQRFLGEVLDGGAPAVSTDASQSRPSTVGAGDDVSAARDGSSVRPHASRRSIRTSRDPEHGALSRTPVVLSPGDGSNAPRTKNRTFASGDGRRRSLVGVHVRRGDKADALSDDVMLAYLARALRYMNQTLGDVPLFVVTSDDIAWCRNQTELFKGSEVIFSPFTAVGDDLALLAHCNHTIMTIGTFGWWAAWLANGRTVYKADTREVYSTPPHWVSF